MRLLPFFALWLGLLALIVVGLSWPRQVAIIACSLLLVCATGGIAWGLTHPEDD